MIKNEQQYKLARAKCREGAEQLQKQVEGMKVRGYSEDEIQSLTGCTARMLEQGRQAIDLYTRLKGQDASALRGLPLNRQLIGLRIYLGISQSELASALGLTRSELVREEKNEYPNLTLERFGQILHALSVHLVPIYVKDDWPAIGGIREQLLKAAEGKTDLIIIG